MIQRLAGKLSTGLFESSATFKKCTAEKLSFVFLGLLDFILTLIAMNLGLSEINPVISFLVQLPVVFFIVKFFVPMLIAYLMPGKLLLPSIALLAFVVFWDLKELVFFIR
jgi:hypothetical protein